ncbi:FtsB family cell division protein [Listeria fleischmannii]|jgi:cell division protein DivIC|uniref:Septum formation initiator family protein n=1 Tax=Listeria fleischmannii TaxID=1069827 RepID=A0A841YF18_9LIST|nr:septum formation initiator family protein [Listeria fleischmannii]EIA20166.1 DivIC family protein [Listeria fleischmannii subsp. coloradonensis]MBC1398965.1 septum formation initiator family protein [Listeria fleischmannii]MBC1419686.1 septum formation initiator family protein [Listeria fleischmannii]MBC1427218.1 septum formation initiator family protein [Listeria fleischmannii]STY34698.1 Septum formation initiator [Listeria fleischmannii subsp. coloradonensis]
MKNDKTVTRMQNRYIKDTQTKKKIKNRRRVALARRLAGLAVILAIVFGGLFFTYTKQALLLQEKKAEKVKTEQKLADSKKEEKALKGQINKLHDDDYIAKLARSEYYLSKEGEIIFNTPTENEKKKTSAN